MSENSNPPKTPDRKPEGWAKPVNRLDTDGVSSQAVDLNVDGRKVTSPINGFGQMWQKTYRIRLENAPVDPKMVIRVWKQEFASFWPQGNYFYSKTGKIEPGEVAVLNLAGPGGLKAPGDQPLISTGIMVVYADDESFSFMTPQGHMFAGMNTFSAYEDNGATVAQIQALIRASDPLYELTFRFGLGHAMEDDFWKSTLRNLARRFNARAEPTLDKVLVDSSVQWSQVKNIWHNAAVRTGLYLAASPVRWVGRKLGLGGKQKTK